MKHKILSKDDCLKFNDKKSSYTLHPLINFIKNIENSDINSCIVLPQLIDKKSNHIIQKNILDNNKDVNPVFNFSLPINSNNFLDIVLNINTINKLHEWFKNCDIDDIDIINLVLDLFWKNYYHIINDNLNDFYYFNQFLIKKLFNKDIKLSIIIKIINKIIKKHNDNEIKYLIKIKKYLLKYI